MTNANSFLDSPEGTREEIMRATRLALCEHGYADLTIQRIVEELRATTAFSPSGSPRSWRRASRKSCSRTSIPTPWRRS